METEHTEARVPALSDFARVCLEHCPDADTLEQIGLIFLTTAAELRKQERH
jgi:hypothetical protein